MESTSSKPKLTKRQQEIAALATTGISNKEIARQLNIAEGTVKLHLHAIYSKLGVSNRTMLALLSLQFAYFDTLP